MSIISDLISGGMSGLLGSVGQFAKDLREVFTGKASPEKLAELEQRAMEIDFSINKIQTDINLEEAKHPNIFVAGWRPFIGWTCGFGLAYHFIVRDFFLWVVAIAGIDVQPPPSIDAGQLIALVVSLLGLGAYRAYEKKEGVQSKH